MTTTTSKIHAGIYCRISDDRSGGGLGVERQRKNCVRLAAKLGWTVTDTYIDNDISAYSGKRRPQYERMLGDVIAGRISGVITWHPDRLNRSPRELERLIDVLERHSVALQSVTAGFLDLTTPSGRAVARTLGAWARFESEHKSERIRAKQYELALAGRANVGSHRPFGYDGRGLTVIEAEATVIREMMRRFLGGETPDALSTGLNARGVTTSMGGQWRPSTVVKVLAEARIAGWRDTPKPRETVVYYGTRFLAPAVWPAIVSRRDVERVRKIMGDATLQHWSAYRFLLSGLILCGPCGRRMNCGRRDVSTRRYYCEGKRNGSAGCGKISVSVRVEDTVTSQLHDAVTGGLFERLRLAGRSVFTSEVEAARSAERQVRQVKQDRREGRITDAEFLTQRHQIAHRTNLHRYLAAELALVDLDTLASSASAFGDSWSTATIRRKRAILLASASKIVVLPADAGMRQYKPSRIQIEWRA
jgi:site-specific DNA recombinase